MASRSATSSTGCSIRERRRPAATLPCPVGVDVDEHFHVSHRGIDGYSPQRIAVPLAEPEHKILPLSRPCIIGHPHSYQPICTCIVPCGGATAAIPRAYSFHISHNALPDDCPSRRRLLYSRRAERPSNRRYIMEFEEAVRALHSVRDFKSQEIPDEVLTRIVAVAQRTPSWANSQPWKVYIAKGNTLEKIKREHLSKAMQGAPSTSTCSRSPLALGTLPAGEHAALGRAAHRVPRSGRHGDEPDAGQAVQRLRARLSYRAAGGLPVDGLRHRRLLADADARGEGQRRRLGPRL
ncbi:nitroreductase family protein [Bifidobacterium choerinum]|uniref:nitroreductase family protein n=1 Tax=Bifidobacterium choerinum TaxID=35760 RepID=UPI00126A26A0